MSISVGVDIGGTFTDIVMQTADGRIRQWKVPSNRKEPASAALTGLTQAVASTGWAPSSLSRFLHGTTVTTNAIIERSGSPTAFLTTAGFRDVLEIGRLRRAPELLYDIHGSRPNPLVPRRLRREVLERISADGEVVVPLDEASTVATVRELAAIGVEAIGVCTLFSYVNPIHEHRIREIIQDVAPAVYVCLSSDIAPEWREFERAATTSVAAYCGPMLSAYLADLAGGLREYGANASFHLMQSNGGLSAPELAIRNPATSLVSGPAAGVRAAAFFGELVGVRSVISADMGGTSFDVGLVVDGAVQVTVDRQVSGIPLQLPMVDIEAIGAGGGSICWLDASGALHVGPSSAGANPGPAAYGLGGKDATVTDADFVLGYLDPRYFGGGQVQLQSQLASQALASLAAGGVGGEAADVAAAIWTIVNANMAGAIRLVSVQRGLDPRDFALVAFGGAGPVHAVALAQEIGIPWVAVPPAPGVGSAFGLLLADTRHDYVRTMPTSIEAADNAKIDEALRGMESAARRDLDIDGVRPESQVVMRSAELRYKGQGYAVQVEIIGEHADVETLALHFHDQHHALYGFSVVSEPVELVSLRLVGIGRLTRPLLAARGCDTSDPSKACVGRRQAYDPQRQRFVSHEIYDRSSLLPGNTVVGPAVIMQRDSTTVVPAEYVAAVTPHDLLMIGRTVWGT